MDKCSGSCGGTSGGHITLGFQSFDNCCFRRAERRRREAAQARGEEENISDNFSTEEDEDEESDNDENLRGRMCTQS